MPGRIGRDEVQQLLKEGAQLVEVLPAPTYKKEHLPGAINIPFKEMDRQATARLDGNRPIVVYCYDLQCDLSARASWLLESFGFPRVFDYVAGKEDWFAHDLPMEGTKADEPRAGDKIDRDVPTCAPSERIGAVRERAKAAGWDACVVVNEQRIVLGLLGPYEFGAAADACVADIMEHGPSTSRPHAPLSDLREYFQKQQRSVAVVSTSAGVLLGLLRRDAL